MDDCDPRTPCQKLTCALGTVQYRTIDIITFRNGLYGFEDYDRFVFVVHDEFKPFRWLVSLDDPELMFTVIDPTLVCKDYDPQLNHDTIEQLWTLVSIDESNNKVTVNLRAPIIIQENGRQGEQIISPVEAYELRFEIRPPS